MAHQLLKLFKFGGFVYNPTKQMFLFCHILKWGLYITGCNGAGLQKTTLSIWTGLYTLMDVH